MKVLYMSINMHTLIFDSDFCYNFIFLSNFDVSALINHSISEKKTFMKEHKLLQIILIKSG